ncbi:MAG: ribonuclease P protein component [Sedimentisphaerales bacterium]|nr:ribonuclease P protein component [Sedimentisphaerales bacterium]
MKRHAFKKRMRLAKNSDFRAVLARKCSSSNGLACLYVAENYLNYSRFGVSVPKRCGSSVFRNRLKRLAREAFRLEQQNLPCGRDYFLIFTLKSPKKATSESPPKCGPYHSLTFDRMRQWLLDLTARAGKRLDRIQHDKTDGCDE